MSTPSYGSRTGSSPTPQSDWSTGSTRSGCGADAGGRLRRLSPHCSSCPPLGDFVASDDYVGYPWHGHAMIHKRQPRGVELRYALTMYLFQHGPQTVADLVGRASKVVSDALRSEIAHSRVFRLKRGRYGPGEMPRATEYRRHQRALALREEAAVIASQNDDAFWNALGA